MKSFDEIIAVIAGNDSYNAAQEKQANVIGKRICQARKDLGLTTRELAVALSFYGVNTSFQAITRWESGYTTPNPYQLVALCIALRIDNIHDLISVYIPPLNSEGRAKVRSYTEDLISSGKYIPTILHTPYHKKEAE